MIIITHTHTQSMNVVNIFSYNYRVTLMTEVLKIYDDRSLKKCRIS